MPTQFGHITSAPWHPSVHRHCKWLGMNFILALFASLLAVGGSGGSSSGSAAGAAAAPGADKEKNTDAGDGDETLASLTSPDTAFYAEDGTLILEAESAQASGAWVERTVDGEKAMLWDAETNSYNKAQDGEALSFEFVAEEAGTYFIGIHGGRVCSMIGVAHGQFDPGDIGQVADCLGRLKPPQKLRHGIAVEHHQRGFGGMFT